MVINIDYLTPKFSIVNSNRNYLTTPQSKYLWHKLDILFSLLYSFLYAESFEHSNGLLPVSRRTRLSRPVINSPVAFVPLLANILRVLTTTPRSLGALCLNPITLRQMVRDINLAPKLSTPSISSI
ncbi:hypothetical protein OIDMADRAFT_17973, partial [Oidiodendron maius Zn]